MESTVAVTSLVTVAVGDSRGVGVGGGVNVTVSVSVNAVEFDPPVLVIDACGVSEIVMVSDTVLEPAAVTLYDPYHLEIVMVFSLETVPDFIEWVNIGVSVAMNVALGTGSSESVCVRVALTVVVIEVPNVTVLDTENVVDDDIVSVSVMTSEIVIVPLRV